MQTPQLLDDIEVENVNYQRVTVFVTAKNLAGIMAAAQRDARPVGHVLNVALEKYIDGRKL
jgi:hypothetical protein